MNSLARLCLSLAGEFSRELDVTTFVIKSHLLDRKSMFAWERFLCFMLAVSYIDMEHSRAVVFAETGMFHLSAMNF